jgi:hypothetical protein
MFGALASTATAILILNLTIIQFSGANTESIQLVASSKLSGILAMTVLAGAICAVHICVVISWWANDFKSPQRARRKLKTEDLFV